MRAKKKGSGRLLSALIPNSEKIFTFFAVTLLCLGLYLGWIILNSAGLAKAGVVFTGVVGKKCESSFGFFPILVGEVLVPFPANSHQGCMIDVIIEGKRVRIGVSEEIYDLADKSSRARVSYGYGRLTGYPVVLELLSFHP